MPKWFVLVVIVVAAGVALWLGNRDETAYLGSSKDEIVNRHAATQPLPWSAELGAGDDNDTAPIAAVDQGAEGRGAAAEETRPEASRGLAPTGVSSGANGEEQGASEVPPVLSPSWVQHVMWICSDYAFDGCQQDRDFAVNLASGEQGQIDSWAYQQEHTLGEYFEGLASSGTIKSASVVCTERGCLAFVTGERKSILRRGSTDGRSWITAEPAFWEGMHEQRWISEFRQTVNRHSGKNSNYSAIDFLTTDPEFGFLLIFARRPP